MPLCSELKELLSGFEKRMKMIHITRCLLEYPYPEQMKAMIPDRAILDNLIVAVLVYIKDRTLGTEQKCTLSDVEKFLDEFSAVIPNGSQIDSGVLARYIIVTVLQNGGAPMEYLTFSSKSEAFEPMTIRLLNEEQHSYHLTDDAFDFLFRSKEIETELDYSVTRFRMREYMRRDHYEQALDASRELVSRIRNMKVSMDDFLLRCREDLSGITVDQYEGVILRIRALLDREYEELTEIQEEAKSREAKLNQARQSGLSGDEIRKSRAALREIIHNITLTIEEQRTLINKKQSLSEQYQELIRDSFRFDRYERLNFEKDILAPMRMMGDGLGDAAKFLLSMFEKPAFPSQFSVENFYAPQGKLTQQEQESGIDLTGEESEQEKLIAVRNIRNQKIVADFFSYAVGRTLFTVSGFISSLRVSDLMETCAENALPNVILSMFAMQELDVEQWKNGERFLVEPNGEFELGWCLEKLQPELLDLKKMVFHKLDRTFRFDAETDGIRRKMELTDFEVEVVR